MKISLLIIASEILEGKVQDINTLNLSKLLKSHGYTLNQVVTVSDDENLIIQGLDFFKESELVVVSGGLGPTPDDLTKFCLAKYFNCPIKKTPESIEISSKNFINRGRTIPENHPYQFIPEKARPLFNSEGQAPGILFTENSKTLISLPGVPREFKAMIAMFLPSFFQDKDKYIFDFIIRTKGIGEEAIFNKLDPELWKELTQFGAVASLPYLLGVDVTIRLNATSIEELEKKKEKLHTFINSHPLKNYIWHIGENSLEACIIEKAKSLGLRFGFAESCTAGLCSDKITNVNGSSSVFYGSLVCYNTEIKTQFLNVPSSLIDQFDVVSSPVAEKMAEGLKALFPIDISVALTGHAGPHPKEDQIPTGTVYVATTSELGTLSSHHQFHGSREHLKEAFSQVALFQLLETLEKLALR